MKSEELKPERGHNEDDAHNQQSRAPDVMVEGAKVTAALSAISALALAATIEVQAPADVQGSVFATGIILAAIAIGLFSMRETDRD